MLLNFFVGKYYHFCPIITASISVTVFTSTGTFFNGVKRFAVCWRWNLFFGSSVGFKVHYVCFDPAGRPFHMQATAQFPPTKIIKVLSYLASLVVYVQLEIVKGKQRATGSEENGY